MNYILEGNDILGTTKVLAPITPPNMLDEYPTHLEEFGQGGYRSIDKIENIKERYIKDGMLVNEIDEKRLHYLKDDTFIDFPFVYPEQGLKFYTDFDNDLFYEIKLTVEDNNGTDYSYFNINKDGLDLFKIREDGVLGLREFTEIPENLPKNSLYIYDNECYVTFE